MSFGIDALSVLIFGPAQGAFVVAAIASFGTSKQVGRWLALILSLLFALLSIKVFADYQAAGLGHRRRAIHHRARRRLV